MSAVSDLRDFIAAAEKNRKYAPGTAVGRKAALSLFDKELNENERESIDLIEQHLPQIYSSVFQKNKTKMAASSLQTYRKRMEALLREYKQFADPAEFDSWNPATRKTSARAKRDASKAVRSTPPEEERLSTVNLSPGSGVERFEIVIGDGRKGVLIFPSDRTEKDVAKLQKLVDFLKLTSTGGENESTKNKNSD